MNAKIYFDAAFKIFGSCGRAEAWLDNNSYKLTGNAKTIEEAKREIYSFI